MRDQARAVVIGGGVTGTSVLYHLARKGWSDVVLCERTELTAGSTWHSAGHVILYTLNDTVSRLNQYSVELYGRLEAETGQDPGFHRCGNLRLATHPDRLLELRRYAGMAEALGVEAPMLGPDEVRELWPLLDLDGVLAALYNVTDGHIAPADLTQALAAGARQAGAEIYRHTEVTGLERTPGGDWRVRTNRGDIVCEHVVSCTGNYTRQTMALAGLPAHAVPVKHQFVVTEPIPELVERRGAGLPELPVMRDPEQSFYVRQEGVGLAMGAYEEKGEAVFVDGVPASFGQDLFPDDLDRLLPFLERAMARVPALEKVGIKDVINGPMPYTPDDMPTAGPAPGRPGLWLGEGNPFGITLAGGIGWQLAEWIVEGEPTIDTWPCDVRRFGDFATRRYCAIKTEEAYERTYLVPKPEEELPAGRPLKTGPLHDLLADRGAVFGAVYGWERPNWFAPEGVDAADRCDFRRPNYFEHVGAECLRVRDAAGLADTSAAARFRVHGPAAASVLSAVLCTRLPAPGRVAPGYALSGRGTVRSEFAVAARDSDEFLLVAAPGAERYDLDLLERASAAGGDVRVENLTGRMGGLALAGPRAVEVLSAAAGRDLAGDPIPVGAVREITVGLAPVVASRGLASGTERWDLQVPAEMLRHVFLALEEAGRPAALGLFGARAANSLRLDAGEPAWGSDLTREFTALESGLEDLVDFERGGFRGFEALSSAREAGRERRLVHLEVPEAGEIAPLGREPLRAGGVPAGRTTSGGFGHCSGRALAIGYLDARIEATDLQVRLLGEWYGARELAG